MPLSDVSNAIYYYLQPSVSNIPSLGTVYQSLPKIANEQDLFLNSYPGQGIGATIFMYFTNQVESRKALGGQHGGRKERHYTLSLLINFKSDLSTVEAGQIAYNSFIDALCAWIQADRNAGTEAANLGGFGPYVGTGYVWQWGEGTELGGPDLEFQHMIPRTVDGGVMLWQSLARIMCVEFFNT